MNQAFAQAAAEMGLSVAQAELLCAAMRPAPVGAIAAQLGCDRSNVTRLADRAELRGLLTRTPDTGDRRVTMVSLSPRGDRLGREFIKRLERQLDGFLEGWPPRRQADAVRTMDALSAALEHVVRSGEDVPA